MKNQLVVEIAEGLGNQLFKYSYAYALANEIDYNLLIDDSSGYSKKKNTLRNHQKYMLDCLNISQNIAPNSLKYNNFLKRSQKKMDIFIDKFRLKKKFIFEKKIKIGQKKTVKYTDFPNIKNLSKTIYISGYFENQNYFNHLRSDLTKMYKPLPKFLKKDLNIIDKLINSNSVSIHLRRHRFTEQSHEKDLEFNLKKTEIFTNDLISYIKKSVNYFKKNLDKPHFFIWSNDFTEIEKYFDKNDFTYITGNDAINDFNLFSYSKHFIVGASTFHWWGAWLNEYSKKICVCPSNINVSGNDDFYPSGWIRI